VQRSRAAPRLALLGEYALDAAFRARGINRELNRDFLALNRELFGTNWVFWTTNSALPYALVAKGFGAQASIAAADLTSAAFYEAIQGRRTPDVLLDCFAALAMDG
jgi:hypothetical protein